MKDWNPQEYFVYFKGFNLRSCGKRTADQPPAIASEFPIKKQERGECKPFAPLLAPVKACVRHME